VGRLAGFLVCLICPLVWSASASALPFHGYNAYHEPCTGASTYPTTCMGTQEFGWHAGLGASYKPVYRFAVKQDRWQQDGGAYYKQAIVNMRSQGVEPFAVLTRGGLSPVDTEPERQSLYNWAREVGNGLKASAYSVQDYEIFNEPNSATHWGTTPSTYNYATAYCWAVWGLKESGTSARMHLGGVARPAAGVISEQSWLNGVKAYINSNCAGIAIDGVSYHPYTQNSDPATNANAMANLLSTFRGYMNANGLQGAMIMATEIGWNAQSSGSYDLQKRQLMALFDKCWALYGSLYLRGCYWFPLVDTPSQPNLGYGGLVRTDNQPKPSFWEFRARLNR
jgi:hypothetical protein